MKAAVAIWAVLLLMAPALGTVPSSTAMEVPDVMISMVNPGQPCEFLALLNLGDCPVSLDGVQVTDGEGIITFGPLTLSAGGTLYLTQNASLFNSLIPDEVVIGYSDDRLTRSGRFALANDGDQVMIRSNDVTVDAMCYGAVDPPEGWDGGPCVKPTAGHMLHRSSDVRSFNSSAWEETSFGRVTYPPQTVSAPVTPLIFPEAGHVPIVDLIDQAASTIEVSVYTLDDEAIVNALVRARQRSVDISILLEGQPVGGLTTAQKGMASALQEAGCRVLLMDDASSFRRYEFLHAKYAIFDSSTVLVTSENWGSGLHNNRGWGAIIRSEQLALSLHAIFLNDTDRRWGDLVMPGWAVQEPLGCDRSGSYGAISYMASVTLLVSPDAPAPVMISTIASCTERLYLEEMSFDQGWGQESGMIDAILSAARRGVGTKVLLDGSSSDLQNRFAINALLEPRVSGLEARLETAYHEFTMVHNKGIIADDKVLVSSINLGHNALCENRETGVLIASAEIADFFSNAFSKDWLPDPDPPHLVLRNTTLSDGSIVLDASGSWDESGIGNITWDLDTDGMFETVGSRVSILPSGKTTVSVRVCDSYGNFVQETMVLDGRAATDDLRYLPWLGIAPLALLAGLFLRKRIK